MSNQFLICLIQGNYCRVSRKYTRLSEILYQVSRKRLDIVSYVYAEMSELWIECFFVNNDNRVLSYKL